MGALIAPAVILGIAHWLGWRASFVAVGSLGLVWFAGWVWISRSPLLGGVWRGTAGGGAAGSGWASYRRVVSSPRFWPVFAVAVLVNPCLYFNVNWLPVYFAQQRGLAAGREMGWILTLIYLGLDLGYLACGAAVIWQVKRGRTLEAARRNVFFTATALSGASAAAPLLPSLPGAVACLVVVNFAVGVWISLYLTMAQEVSAENVSTAAGLLGGSGSLAGALAMWAVGRVTRQTGSFVIPMASVAVAGVLAAASAVRAQRARVGR